MSSLIDMTGKRFGRLMVIDRAENYIDPSGKQKARWNCICDCGKKVIVVGGSLRRGLSKSCGCWSADLVMERSTIHGMARRSLHRSSEYTAYAAAKDRCTNPQNPGWKNYGGRGIEFRFSNFQEFVDAIGSKNETRQQRNLSPDVKLSLDRIDNDGHYEPGNVRWATKEEQAKNQTKANQRLIAELKTRVAELEAKLAEYEAA